MQTRYWNLQNDTDGVMLREAAALIKQGEAAVSYTHLTLPTTPYV